MVEYVVLCMDNFIISCTIVGITDDIWQHGVEESDTSARQFTDTYAVTEEQR